LFESLYWLLGILVTCFCVAFVVFYLAISSCQPHICDAAQIDHPQISQCKTQVHMLRH